MPLQPQWYNLQSKWKTSSKKNNDVSGQIQLQFSLVDPSNPSAPADQILSKFKNLIRNSDDEEEDATPTTSGDNEEAGESSREDLTRPDAIAQQRQKSKVARLKRRSIAVRAYEFCGAKDGVVGIVFIEINKVLDLPPEKNSTSKYTFLLPARSQLLTLDSDPYIL